MAEIAGNLWEWNFAKVVVVDVTDDYRLMQAPMPSEFYPVIEEVWMPAYNLAKQLPSAELATGYLYDWHQCPAETKGEWYVGVVHSSLLDDPMFSSETKN